jgi:5-methylcytosine-specific restriction enzyme B
MLCDDDLLFTPFQPKFNSNKFKAFLFNRGVPQALLDLLVGRMVALNTDICSDEVRLGAGYQIGHSFFVPNAKTEVLDGRWYIRIIQHEVGPLLDAYWFDDVEKAKAGKLACLTA